MYDVLEMGGRAQETSDKKATKEGKDLIRKRRDMKVRSRRNKVELAELTKLTNNRKLRHA